MLSFGFPSLGHKLGPLIPPISGECECCQKKVPNKFLGNACKNQTTLSKPYGINEEIFLPATQRLSLMMGKMGNQTLSFSLISDY